MSILMFDSQRVVHMCHVFFGSFVAIMAAGNSTGGMTVIQPTSYKGTTLWQHGGKLRVASEIYYDLI